MFSNPITPGVITWLVKGYSATVGAALVTAATSCDLPALGRPMTANWATPSLSTTIDDRWVAPLRPVDWLSLAIRRLRSPLRWSVPLCFGITASISSRAVIFSGTVLAARKRFSAS